MTASVLLLGASSATGQALLRQWQPDQPGVALSRQVQPSRPGQWRWRQHDFKQGPCAEGWHTLVSLGPLDHALKQVQALPECHTAHRVIALSSASTLFKSESEDAAERAQMQRLLDTEAALQTACQQRGVALTILKTTMLYGGIPNANIDRLAQLMARLPIMPVVGQGRRHPVHVEDLAALVAACLNQPVAATQLGVFVLGGGEVLNYPQMLQRIAQARGLSTQVWTVPLICLKPMLALAHAFGALRDVQAVMLARQTKDLLVDDHLARQRLAWQPGPFRP